MISSLVKYLFTLFLIISQWAHAQIDLPGDDTLRNLPLLEMTNRGISRIDFCQNDIRFVLINVADSSVAFSWGDVVPGQDADTIYLAKPELFNPNQIDDFDVMNYCEYRGGEKWGKEYGFYTFDELNRVTITGWHFRLKFTGHWKDGKKDGTWHYFSPNGEVIRTEKWKKGTLVSVSAPR
jgi:hypothetical protein